MENPLRINTTKAAESLETVRMLRYAVLREPLGMSYESTLFHGDMLPDTLHLIAEFGSESVGCLTLLCEPLEIPAAFPNQDATDSHPAPDTAPDAPSYAAAASTNEPLVNMPGQANTPSRLMQLRGMAVLASHQRHGIGRQLLLHAEQIARSNERRLWCKAREIAVPFYERNGWMTTGDYFDIPNIGPHVIMWR